MIKREAYRGRHASGKLNSTAINGLSKASSQQQTGTESESILRLTFDSEIFLAGAVLSMTVAALSASTYVPCLGTVDAIS